MLNFFKKNQIIIYVIAFMLVTAGYLNYTSNNDMQSLLSNADPEQISENTNIGDAQLVNSNDVIENKSEEQNTTSDNTISNTTDTNTTNSNQTDSNIVEDTNVNTEETETEKEELANASNSDEYFTTSKLERDTMYSQMIETYEKVLNSSNSLETQKQSVTEEIKKINDTKNSIMICENLIGTKGFKNSVIFVNGDSITAIIGATELSQEEVAQIQNIISREMKAEIENIHIAIK